MTGTRNAVQEIVPERDTELAASLFETGEGIAAPPSEVATGLSTDLSPRDLLPEVRLTPIGVQGHVWPLEHQQQF